MAKKSAAKGQMELIDFAEGRHQERAAEDGTYIEELVWPLAEFVWRVEADDKDEGTRQLLATAQKLIDRGEGRQCP